MRRELERIEIPGEHEARERTWTVLRAAFADRQPVERSVRRLRPILVLAAALALLAAAVSPPGRAVLDEIREVVGVERAQQALFSLPAEGDLLVASDDGVWVVREDGSRRLLGDYREATWSPFGRFVAATRQNELTALEPGGVVRWTLARRGVKSPRWTGTETDTRIAYVDRTGIRIVAGDGIGDRLVVAGARGPLAWRPGHGLVLAYASPREVRVLDIDSARLLWRAARPAGPAAGVEWSSDGARVLVVTSNGIRVLHAGTGAIERTEIAADAAFRPGGRELALIRHRGEASEVLVGDRIIFRGAGELRGLAWSPDGRWLLVGWPAADQWVFVRADGRGIRAVSNISEQFRSRTFPRVEGWCCAG